MSTLKPLIIGETAIHFNTALTKARTSPIKGTEIICGHRRQQEEVYDMLSRAAAPGQFIQTAGPVQDKDLDTVYATYKNTLNNVMYNIHTAIPCGRGWNLYNHDFKGETLLFRYTDEGK